MLTILFITDKYLKRFFALFMLGITLILVSGCATVLPETPLPSQYFSAPIEKNKTRVVFHNTSNKILYMDASSLIGVKVDGKGVANIGFDQYVQIDLIPGKHLLELSHFDAVTFRDSYDFIVKNQTMYVEVFNGIVSTKYKSLIEKPASFEKDFKPYDPADDDKKAKSLQ